MADWIQAIGTIIAVLVAMAVPVWQMKIDSKRNNEARVENNYYELRHNAFLVDSWITRSQEGWKICIVNDSEGPIRNIQVHAQWPELAHQRKHLDPANLTVIPKAHKPWRTFSRGNWIISPKSATENLQYSAWDYPICKNSREELPSPAFFDSDGDKHTLAALRFTDVYDNAWVRIYSCAPEDYNMKPGLYLLATSDKRLQKYVKQTPYFAPNN
ncbi:type II secretory pathway pseudopilin PulG [Bifidobacterium commune]|uniref:Uncharacterized protein n=1 Tax=Bifidobacterium commune TaxID=1505727 RepID=A0A1C4H365_9BIFI|nr:hypothetical protein [Bifidobacterium commune]MBB2955070.1 type II secretory pathway pseudopilin PulG [Bifidobacterium commune]SCC79387.1 hypothetical protein GA0061077_0704 [Bifidobacterium commune]